MADPILEIKCGPMNARLTIRACRMNQKKAGRAAQLVMDHKVPQKACVSQYLPPLSSALLDYLWACAKCPRASPQGVLRTALAKWDKLYRLCMHKVEHNRVHREPKTHAAKMREYRSRKALMN